MQTVVWFLRPGSHPEKKFQSFAERLAGAGLKTEWHAVPESGMDAKWLNDVLAQNVRGVIVSQYDEGFLKTVASSLESHAEITNGLPLTFVYENLPTEKMAELAKWGVHELSSLSESPGDFLSRLNFRAIQLNSHRELKRQLKTASAAHAKNETALKQREEFLSVCAHDLRSPLGLVQSSLSMLLGNKVSFNEFQVELISRARRQAEQGIRLVNDLLDVMAYEQGLKPEFELVSLDGFLSELHQDYAFQAREKQINITYENPAKELRVLIDPDRMRQLFQNLFVNALKFTESGKNIHLNVMPFQGRRKVDPPYPMVVVSLRDEGRGIPKNEVEKIFNKFTQVKDYGREQGRGLGLSVAKQISTLHNGNIWVQSVEGEGSTFFILFPYVLGHRSLRPIAKNTKRIVVAEPNKENQARFYEILGRWGFETIFANDGAEALTLSCFYQPNALLLGTKLPKVGENEIALAMKSDSVMRSTPVLLCGKANLDSTEKELFDGTLPLPFNRQALEIALDRAKRGQGIKKAA